METRTSHPQPLPSAFCAPHVLSLLDQEKRGCGVAPLREWGRRVLASAYGGGSESVGEEEDREIHSGLDSGLDSGLNSGLDSLSPRIIFREVDALLCAALGIGQTALYTRAEESPAPEMVHRFREFIDRRLKGEPLAYILGEQDFFSGTLVVSDAVLIPRPETELLVERALRYFSPESKGFFLADIGTGSGAILWGVLHELKRRFGEEYLNRGWTLAVDRSFAALEVARHNLREVPVSFLCGDLLAALSVSLLHPHSTESSIVRADEGANAPKIFLANLPYIPNGESLPRSVESYEPQLALRGGERGTEVIERFIKELAHVTGEYRVLLEVGAGQAEMVAECLSQNGMQEIIVTADYRGILRIVEGSRVCA